MFTRLKNLFTKNKQKESTCNFIKRKETERSNRLNTPSTPSNTQVVHDHSDQDFLTTMLILDAIDKSPSDYAAGNIIYDGDGKPSLDPIPHIDDTPKSSSSDSWSSSSSSDSWSSSSSSDSWSSSSSSDSWSSSDSSSSGSDW